MTETPKTVFVTKYALTKGITEHEMIRTYAGGAASVKGLGSALWDRDWHATREAAVSRANQMRDAKLTSLNKQVERLRGMRF